MTHSLENHGFLIFFISILIVTQLRWAETYNYNDIALRLSAAVLAVSYTHLTLPTIYSV